MKGGWFALASAAGVAGVGYWWWSRSQRDTTVGGDPDAPDSTEAPNGTDQEGMARMLASEAEGYSEAERIAIGWCAMNFARRRGKTIAQVMLPPHHQAGHFCSTYQEATESDRELAGRVLRNSYVDPTDGAIAFFEPAEQDREFRQGKVRLDTEGVRAKWRDEDHLILSATIGRWEFFRKARSGDVS